MARPKTFSKCHPTILHFGHGKCRRCYMRLYYSQQPKKKRTRREYKKAWYKRHRVRLIIKAYERQLRRLYNLTQEEYRQLFLAQKEVCAICYHPQAREGKRLKNLAVDHDHRTNKIRGLLCIACNTGMGWLDKYQTAIFEYNKKAV